MCGIFGFIAKRGGTPDLDLLRRLAVDTQRRGHHAFGLAWLDDSGSVGTLKRPGPATQNLGDLAACENASIVVGHCRWATHGSPDDNRNNHPHRAGRGWFVHNGVVENHAVLTRTYRLQPTTQCDSEILGLLMAKFPGSLALRAKRTVERARGQLAILGIWPKPGRLLIVRNGNPLHFGAVAGGLYFASMPCELPGKPLSVRDEYAGTLRFDGTRLLHDAFTIS